MDFTDPTPARGLCSHWSMAAAERFKCDMILAMANLHRFVFERSLSVEQVVDGLWSFSKRWLIGEFVPPERGSVIDSSSQTRNHYSFDQLIAGLRSRFRRISILSPENAPALVYLVEK